MNKNDFYISQMVEWEDLRLQIVDWDEAQKLFRCLVIRGDGEDFRRGAWIYLEPEELKAITV